MTTGPGGLLLDIKDYYTAPLRWDVRDWAYFAGALGLIAGAHHYDTQVRDHYVKDPTAPLSTKNSKELQDALPAVAALAGTWVYANLIDDDDGRREVWGMLEAAGLSTVTSYGLKFAAGRERPDETTDPDKWRAGGSFLSIHTCRGRHRDRYGAGRIGERRLPLGPALPRLRPRRPDGLRATQAQRSLVLRCCCRRRSRRGHGALRFTTLLSFEGRVGERLVHGCAGRRRRHADLQPHPALGTVGNATGGPPFKGRGAHRLPPIARSPGMAVEAA